MLTRGRLRRGRSRRRRRSARRRPEDGEAAVLLERHAVAPQHDVPPRGDGRGRRERGDLDAQARELVRRDWLEARVLLRGIRGAGGHGLDERPHREDFADAAAQGAVGLARERHERAALFARRGGGVRGEVPGGERTPGAHGVLDGLAGDAEQERAVLRAERAGRGGRPVGAAREGGVADEAREVAVRVGRGRVAQEAQRGAVRHRAQRQLDRHAPADRRARAVHDRAEAVRVARLDARGRLGVDRGGAFAHRRVAARAVGSVVEVLAVVREVGRDDEQRVAVHQFRQRPRAHRELLLPEGPRHERDDGEARRERELQERELDLRGVLGGVDAVVAQDGRDELEAPQPVAVDRDFAEGRRDCVRLGRDEAVLDPGAVAGREDDRALERPAANGAHRVPGDRAGIRPARVGRHHDVRALRRNGQGGVRRRLALPLLRHSADLRLRGGVP